MEENNNTAVLQTADYVVIVAMLIVPLGIGVFFAIKDAKKTTKEEYFLGGRRMAMLPVTLSIFVTYQSAISLMGFPSEVYLHGPMVFGMYIGITVIYLLAYHTLVPLLYPLQLTSIYEYVEMRFQSKVLRVIAALMGIVQNFFYMTIALLAPGLALEAAAGIPLWVSVVIVGGTGTIYTAAGGIKSVIWTDVFQTIILFIGVYGVMIKSTSDVGGVKNVFEIAEAGGRTRFDSISPDPRERHTWWTTITGGTFMWLGQMFNQSTLQRISSMRSMRDARRTMLVNIPVNLFYGMTVILLGWCLYAYLHHIQCDPVHAGVLTNYNQLSPYFVLHTMHSIPGMSGLYMSSLFSAALSTISSGINSLAANTVEDILQKQMSSLSEKTASIVTKIVVFVYGAGLIALAYGAKSMQGPVTQMSTTVVGLFGSSVAGMIVLGCTVPWANKYGAVSGTVVSLAINLWLGIGARLYGRPIQSLAPVPSDQCFNSTLFVHDDYSSMMASRSLIGNQTYDLLKAEVDVSEHGFSPYDLSYQLYGCIGVVVSFVVGFIVSGMTRDTVKTKTEPKLILRCLHGFWNLNEPVTGDGCELLVPGVKSPSPNGTLTAAASDKAPGSEKLMVQGSRFDDVY